MTRYLILSAEFTPNTAIIIEGFASLLRMIKFVSIFCEQSRKFGVFRHINWLQSPFRRFN